ncbi:unnamed protein product [Penicillium salamii]|nr:unnamed protein product [Penicillium salamii]
MSKLSWEKPPQRGFSGLTCAIASVFCLATGYYYGRQETSLDGSLAVQTSVVGNLQKCAIDNLLGTGLPFLEKASPISLADFEERRDRLAIALVAEDVDAFVVEPGYTFKYYGNVSQPEWEVWEPEERPFLMIVHPQQDEHGTVTANTTFLCPSFEAERARLLGMPFDGPIQIVPWEEHWDPYATLQQANIFNSQRPPRLMVDEEMRDFIQRGLGTAGFEIVGLKGQVEEVRQIKSASEVEILRAVNTGTVEAVRQIRKYENASNPHGGTNGSKVLEPETFVLIDVGAHLYGYSSDICRTFFPPFLEKPSGDDNLSERMKEKLQVWDIVFEAQTQSIHQIRENATAASVDIAAREVITEAGYGETFTHRVGHGIGIKAHESPYLNQGNVKSLLKTGMTFTSEPGVYLVDKFGVRHEDVFLVQGDEEPVLLTGTRAGGPWDP